MNLSVIILCFDWTPSSAFDFLIQAKSSEMLNPEYVYIILSVELRLLASWKPWDLLNQTDTGKISLAKTVFSNSIVVKKNILTNSVCKSDCVYKITTTLFEVQTIGFEIDLLSNYKNYLEDDVYNRTGFPFELSTGVCNLIAVQIISIFNNIYIYIYKYHSGSYNCPTFA